MKNNISTILIAIVALAAAYYFLVVKKSSDTGTKTPPAVKLNDKNVEGLTYGQIQMLSLEQIDALTPSQLALLTDELLTTLDVRRTKLRQEKAAADAAAAAQKKAEEEAALKKAEEERIAAEKKRTDALKTKMGSITGSEILSMSREQVEAITVEELAYLKPGARIAYGVATIPTDKRNEISALVSAILGDCRGWGAHYIPYYQRLSDYSDEYFYYAVHYAWKNVEKRWGLYHELDIQNWNSTKPGGKAKQLKAIIAGIKNRAVNLVV